MKEERTTIINKIIAFVGHFFLFIWWLLKKPFLFFVFFLFLYFLAFALVFLAVFFLGVTRFLGLFVFFFAAVFAADFFAAVFFLAGDFLFLAGVFFFFVAFLAVAFFVVRFLGVPAFFLDFLATTLFAGFFFGAAGAFPTLKDPDAPVPLVCISLPVCTPRFKATFKCEDGSPVILLFALMYFSMACLEEPPRSFIAVMAVTTMSMYGGCAAAGRRAGLFALGFFAFFILPPGLFDLDLERDLERDLDLDLDRERDLGKTTDILITYEAGVKKVARKRFHDASSVISYSRQFYFKRPDA